MRITHYINSATHLTNITEENVGFLLTNKQGGYLWLESEPRSRYQGWFFTPPKLLGLKLFKVIENIELVKAPPVTELVNSFWRVKRRRGNITETFFAPYYTNAFVYEVSEPMTIEVIFDVKDSYDNREEGRHYDIHTEEDSALITFTQEGLPPIFIAVQLFKGVIEPINQWMRRHYERDHERNSYPYERAVLKGLRVKTNKLVFAVSTDTWQAMAEARYILKVIPQLETMQKQQVLHLQPRIKQQDIVKQVAFFCARHALDSLLVRLSTEGKEQYGLYAGLPWFFQLWARDEAICLPALARKDKEYAKQILWRHLESIDETGSLQSSADAALWSFRRAREFIAARMLNKEEKEVVKKAAEKTLKLLEKHYMHNHLPITGERHTWMDSITRDGARLEICALHLSLCALARELSTGKSKRQYQEQEERLKKLVYSFFWNGSYFADGVNSHTGEADWTITPNVFLAAYIYPELVVEPQWIMCFETILPRLWLEWGGFASLDIKHGEFRPYHTGEVAESYHRGDSWFLVNNLAALVLHHFDKIRYKEYIDKVFEASTEEILWHGIVGYHAELSSAAALASQGCLAQSWSSAMYGELVECVRL